MFQDGSFILFAMIISALIGGVIGWILKGRRYVDTWEPRYNSLLTDHNDLKADIGRYKGDADKYKTDYSGLKSRLNNMVEKSQLVEVENKWKSSQTDLDRSKTELKNLEVELSDTKRKLKGMVAPAIHSDVENSLATLKTENATCSENLLKVQGELEGLKKDSVARNEFDELSTKFTSLKSKYDDASSKLKSFEGEGDQFDMRDRMTGLRNEIMTLKSENDKLRAGAPAGPAPEGGGEWEAKYNALKADHDAAQSKISALESAEPAAPSKGSGSSAELAKLQDKYDALKKKQDNSVNKVAELTASLSNANIAANSGVPQSKYDELEAKYNALKSGNNFENKAPDAAPVEPPVVEEATEEASAAPLSAVSSPPAEPESAPAAEVKKDDLTKIEGIGPKTREVLHAAGINTFCELASKSAVEIKSILDASDGNFDLSDTSTWPQQSSLACDGKWDELNKLQDELDGGRGTAAAAPVEKKVLSEDEKKEAAKDLVSKLGEGSKDNADDLKKISGVGPKMEATLNQIGIYRFSQVAKMTKSEYDVLDSITGSFPGRAERDDWAGQAATLAQS